MKKLLASSIILTLLSCVGTMCMASSFQNIDDNPAPQAPGYYIRKCYEYEPETISIKFYDTSYAPDAAFLTADEINDAFYYLVKYKETDTTASFKYIQGSDLRQQPTSIEDVPLNI